MQGMAIKHRARLGRKLIQSICLFVFASYAVAQIVPGYREPRDLADGAVMAVTGGCWLATTNRPVPGINMPANGLAGEGLKEQRSAPKWVEKASAAQGRSKFSTFNTPEGDIWIRYDHETARCSLIVRPSDMAKFRSAFGDALAGTGLTALARETGADGSEVFKKVYPEVEWTSRVTNPPEMPDVVLVETTAIVRR